MKARPPADASAAMTPTFTRSKYARFSAAEVGRRIGASRPRGRRRTRARPDGSEARTATRRSVQRCTRRGRRTRPRRAPVRGMPSAVPSLPSPAVRPPVPSLCGPSRSGGRALIGGRDATSPRRARSASSTSRARRSALERRPLGVTPGRRRHARPSAARRSRALGITAPSRRTLVSTVVPQARSCPIESASISIAVPDFSPFSHARRRSRPWTTTRSPRCTDVAALCASWRNPETVYQLVSPSSHAPFVRSKYLRVEARRNEVIVSPWLVTCTRGSLPTTPVTVMVSVMSVLLGRRRRGSAARGIRSCSCRTMPRMPRRTSIPAVAAPWATDRRRRARTGEAGRCRGRVDQART